jgi:hypothetical protein
MDLTGHTMSPDQIDEAILVCCKPRLQKVARIMGDVTTALNARVDAPFYAPEGSPRGINPELDLITDRIKALVKAKRLVSAGNLDRWGYSEIRLTGK